LPTERTPGQGPDEPKHLKDNSARLHGAEESSETPPPRPHLAAHADGLRRGHKLGTGRLLMAVLPSHKGQLNGEVQSPVYLCRRRVRFRLGWWATSSSESE